MSLEEFSNFRRWRSAWESVRIEREVHYSLFTFGESDLPYYLVLTARNPLDPVKIARGQVKVTRPLIVTSQNSRPEFQHFFDNDNEDQDFEGMVDFMLTRTAAFSHLKFDNQLGPSRIVSDSLEEAVAKLGKQLDDEDEDRVAILTAPHGLGGLAVLRYATERIMQSAPDNITELREHGFLPE